MMMTPINQVADSRIDEFSVYETIGLNDHSKVKRATMPGPSGAPTEVAIKIFNLEPPSITEVSMRQYMDES